MKKISELSFGFSDAENYKRREEKEAFKKLFVQNDFLDEVCKPNISFLIGDKGTGKTAYSIFYLTMIIKTTYRQLSLSEKRIMRNL